MAGKALQKRILSDVTKQGGAEYLFEYFSSGGTMAQLATHYECSRGYVSTALHKVPEYTAVINKARQEAADALVEQGLEMVDALDGGSSTQEIAATREKVQWRKFMAGSYNQERYGNRPQTNVTISVSDMHLDALRKVNADLAQIDAEDRQREAMAIDADYEDVTDEQ
jgi:AraC-like DNA-binding protein